VKSPRFARALLVLALLAPALQAAPSDRPRTRGARPPARETCQPACVVMRVSTRCECSLGKTLPAVSTT
jgi:hypothetical protein